MKSDVLILELIKYLVNNDKQVSQQIQTIPNSESQNYLGNTEDSFSGESNLTELRGLQQKITTQLSSINQTIQQLREEVALLKNSTNGHSNGNGNLSNENTTKYPSNGLYNEIIDETLKSSEFYLQTLISTAFISCGVNRNYFLYPCLIQKNPCVILLQSKSESIGGELLALIGRQVLTELPQDIHQVDDLMRFLNKKMFEFNNNHPSLPKSIHAGCFYVDKRKAKVFFSGVGMNMFLLDNDGIKMIEGAKGTVGVPINQFDMYALDIKRGNSLYMSTIHATGNGLEQAWKSVADKNAEGKREAINQWIIEKNISEVILGLSF